MPDGHVSITPRTHERADCSLAHVWTHTWSLAVEEHFYLLLPALLRALIRQRSPPGDPFRGLVGVWFGIPISGTTAEITAATQREAT